jgi:pSer/pThr/pTyr-binding forkhead associated (FHA) protein/tetratricopeptide (TPR) repeat protein
MSAAMKLEIFQNGQLLQEIPLQKDEMWVGRDEACVIRLDDRAISRKHALLRSTAKGVEFEKKSKFGWIKLNGTETTQATLRDGDRLELGSFEIRVSASEQEKRGISSDTVKLEPRALTELPSELREQMPAAEEPASEPSGDDSAHNGGMNFDFSQSPPDGVEAVSSGEPVANPFEEQAAPQKTSTNLDMSSVSSDGATKIFSVPEKVKAILQFGDGAANVNQYEITDNEIAIGRSQQCHVVLEDKRSSRKHALIIRDGLRYRLKDLGSANGTLVNGERVDEYELQSGDQLQIGDTNFTFQLVQADYEVKKEQFIQVPQHESESVATPLHPQHMPMNMGMPSMPFSNEPMQATVQGASETIQPSFGDATPEPKKSIIGKYLDRYRAMNTKQQIIYGAVILATIWFLMDDDPVQQKAKLNTAGAQAKKVQKKDDKKAGNIGLSFENLTPEQQRYIETQYQLAFDLYKNREYDKSLLEVSKIFSLVQDYRNAREIEAFAREGKRALEAKEEERKRKEAERQAQMKLQTLVEQAGLLMDQKRFKEAESLFPEIELIQPENAAVNEWRKRIMGESERLEQERAEKKRIEDLHRKAWADYQKAQDLVAEKRYYDALDEFDEISARPLTDKKLIQALKDDTQKAEASIAAERDPLLTEGKQLEGEGKLSEAYKKYQKALEVDPLDKVGPEGMKRIRGTLTSKAKFLYTEGVFAESYSDLDTAEKRYREILDVVPKDDDYYLKAQSRLKKLTIFKKPSGESAQ